MQNLLSSVIFNGDDQNAVSLVLSDNKAQVIEHKDHYYISVLRNWPKETEFIFKGIRHWPN